MATDAENNPVRLCGDCSMLPSVVHDSDTRSTS